MNSNKEKIEKLKKGINNPHIPDSLKEKMKLELAKLEKEDLAKGIVDILGKKTNQGKSITDKIKQVQKIEDLILEVIQADHKGLAAAKVTSGSDLEKSIDSQLKYKEAALKELKARKIKKKALNKSVYSRLEDDNMHVLNELLSLNGFYDTSVKKSKTVKYEAFKPSFKKESTPKTADFDGKKIPIKHIEIKWAEGDNSKYDKFPKKYDSFSAANEAVIPVFESLYKDGIDGGYNKLAYEVVYANGETYDGKLNVYKKGADPIKSKNVFGESMKLYLEHLLSPQYKTPIQLYSAEEKEEAKNFLERYSLEDEVIETPKSKEKPEKEYYRNNEILYIIVKEGDKEVAYLGNDVYNGANFEKGGRLSDKTKYFPIRDVVLVHFTDGSSNKPKNGYHVDKNAKPIDLKDLEEVLKTYKPKSKKSTSKEIKKSEPKQNSEKTLKGYSVNIYVPKDRTNDAMNLLNTHFKNIILVTDGKSGNTEIDSNKPYLKLETKEYNFSGKKTINRFAIPVNFDIEKEKSSKMFGGTFLWSSDSRFRDNVSELPLQIHDRVEKFESGGEVTLPPGSFISYENYYLENGGAIEIFDLESFLNLAYPKVKNELAKHNLKLDKDFVIKKGKLEYIYEAFIQQNTKSNKAAKVVLQYTDFLNDEIGTITFELDEMEFHLDFPIWKIKSVDLFEKGGKTQSISKKRGNPEIQKTMQLAKEIRKDGEKWTDAVKRASLELKK